MRINLIIRYTDGGVNHRPISPKANDKQLAQTVLNFLWSKGVESVQIVKEDA